tara:strand:+ start:149 stop:1258 length:1110 start_codon:yes stop_codon:yes gene_type:complete
MKKIVIIGAGISGLYLANLFQKKGNYDYKIFEKKSDIKIKQGYGIQLSPNGVKLLNMIGFNKIISNDIYLPRNINFFDVKNCNLISKIDISQFNNDESKYTLLKRSILIDFLKSKIPKEKLIFNADIKNINFEDTIKIKLENGNTEEAEYLAICDGVFSKTKKMAIPAFEDEKFYNSIALRGTLKNIKSKDISLYLGPNFHFVIYPVNKKEEYNFVSIIKKKKFDKIENIDIESIINKISSETSYDLKNKIENASTHQVYTSRNFKAPINKNVFLAGDALFALPPSFAQGASQSIESSFEVFKEIDEETNKYYHDRELKTKKIKFRSNFNQFAFHLSNPFAKFSRNICLKLLTKNKVFLKNYLGNIYNS